MSAVLATGALPAGTVATHAPPDAQEKLDAERRARDARRREAERAFRNEQAAKASAAINRHTGEPHKHERAKARRLRQIGRAS